MSVGRVFSLNKVGDRLKSLYKSRMGGMNGLVDESMCGIDVQQMYLKVMTRRKLRYCLLRHT